MKATGTNFIFISYSRHDKQVAEQLVDALFSRGIEVWLDTEMIKPGTSWPDEIERGIKAASALLYIASRHSAKSEWMNLEVEAAFINGLRVIPVVIDDTGPSSIPNVLRNLQWVDIRQGLNEAVDDIARVTAHPGHSIRDDGRELR